LNKNWQLKKKVRRKEEEREFCVLFDLTTSPTQPPGYGGLLGTVAVSQAASPAPGPADVAALLLSAIIIYRNVTFNPPTTGLPPSVPMLPPPPLVGPIEARKADLGLVDYIADKYGIPRDLLSEEIHERKRMSGRGGADNLGKKEIEKIAQEIKDMLEPGEGDEPDN
jgi:hypothetical protein